MRRIEDWSNTGIGVVGVRSDRWRDCPQFSSAFGLPCRGVVWYDGPAYPKDHVTQWEPWWVCGTSGTKTRDKHFFLAASVFSHHLRFPFSDTSSCI